MSWMQYNSSLKYCNTRTEGHWLEKVLPYTEHRLLLRFCQEARVLAGPQRDSLDKLMGNRFINGYSKNSRGMYPVTHSNTAVVADGGVWNRDFRNGNHSRFSPSLDLPLPLLEIIHGLQKNPVGPCMGPLVLPAPGARNWQGRCVWGLGVLQMGGSSLAWGKRHVGISVAEYLQQPWGGVREPSQPTVHLQQPLQIWNSLSSPNMVCSLKKEYEKRGMWLGKTFNENK